MNARLENMRMGNIWVILVANEFAGNAGQIARTLGNFEVPNLVLISPQWTDPMQGFVHGHTPEGLEIFDSRLVYPTITAAVTDLGLTKTVALTRRSGKDRQINWSYRDYFSRLCDDQRFPEEKLGLVFGREKTGLTAAEIAECSILAYIPTSSDSPSLNLAQAVAIVLAEIFHLVRVTPAEQYNQELNIKTHTLSSQAEREAFYAQIIAAAEGRKLFIRNDEVTFRRLFERLFASPGVTTTDLGLLRSLLMRFIYAKTRDGKDGGGENELADR